MIRQGSEHPSRSARNGGDGASCRMVTASLISRLWNQIHQRHANPTEHTPRNFGAARQGGKNQTFHLIDEGTRRRGTLLCVPERAAQGRGGMSRQIASRTRNRRIGPGTIGSRNPRSRRRDRRRWRKRPPVAGGNDSGLCGTGAPRPGDPSRMSQIMKLLDLAPDIQ